MKPSTIVNETNVLKKELESQLPAAAASVFSDAYASHSIGTQRCCRR